MQMALGQRKLGVGAGGLPEHANPQGIRVGFKAKGITGVEKTFLHWRNARWNIERLTELCALLFLRIKIEVQIGPGVNASRVAKTKEVKEIGEGIYGLYVDAERLGELQLIKFPEVLQGVAWGPKYLRRLPRNVSR